MYDLVHGNSKNFERFVITRIVRRAHRIPCQGNMACFDRPPSFLIRNTDLWLRPLIHNTAPPRWASLPFQNCSYFANAGSNNCSHYRWQDALPTTRCCACGGGFQRGLPAAPPALPPAPPSPPSLPCYAGGPRENDSLPRRTPPSSWHLLEVFADGSSTWAIGYRQCDWFRSPAAPANACARFKWINVLPTEYCCECAGGTHIQPSPPPLPPGAPSRPPSRPPAPSPAPSPGPSPPPIPPRVIPAQPSPPSMPKIPPMAPTASPAVGVAGAARQNLATSSAGTGGLPWVAALVVGFVLASLACCIACVLIISSNARRRIASCLTSCGCSYLASKFDNSSRQYQGIWLDSNLNHMARSKCKIQQAAELEETYVRTAFGRSGQRATDDAFISSSTPSRVRWATTPSRVRAATCTSPTRLHPIRARAIDNAVRHPLDAYTEEGIRATWSEDPEGNARDLPRLARAIEEYRREAAAVDSAHTSCSEEFFSAEQSLCSSLMPSRAGSPRPRRAAAEPDGVPVVSLAKLSPRILAASGLQLGRSGLPAQFEYSSKEEQVAAAELQWAAMSKQMGKPPQEPPPPEARRPAGEASGLTFLNVSGQNSMMPSPQRPFGRPSDEIARLAAFTASGAEREAAALYAVSLQAAQAQQTYFELLGIPTCPGARTEHTSRSYRPQHQPQDLPRDAHDNAHVPSSMMAALAHETLDESRAPTPFVEESYRCPSRTKSFVRRTASDRLARVRAVKRANETSQRSIDEPDGRVLALQGSLELPLLAGGGLGGGGQAAEEGDSSDDELRADGGMGARSESSSNTSCGANFSPSYPEPFSTCRSAPTEDPVHWADRQSQVEEQFETADNSGGTTPHRAEATSVAIQRGGLGARPESSSAPHRAEATSVMILVARIERALARRRDQRARARTAESSCKSSVPTSGMQTPLSSCKSLVPTSGMQTPLSSCKSSAPTSGMQTPLSSCKSSVPTSGMQTPLEGIPEGFMTPPEIRDDRDYAENDLRPAAASRLYRSVDLIRRPSEEGSSGCYSEANSGEVSRAGSRMAGREGATSPRSEASEQRMEPFHVALPESRVAAGGLPPSTPPRTALAAPNRAILGVRGCMAPQEDPRTSALSWMETQIDAAHGDTDSTTASVTSGPGLYLNSRLAT